jgi:hypothetical protein
LKAVGRQGRTEPAAAVKNQGGFEIRNGFFHVALQHAPGHPSKIPEPAPTVQPAPHGGFLDWLRRTFNPVTAPAADPAPAQGLDFLETLSSTHGDTKVSALKTELDGAVASVKAALAAKDATISDLTAKLAATAGLADAEDTAAMKQAVADLNALAPAPAAEASPAPANQ